MKRRNKVLIAIGIVLIIIIGGAFGVYEFYGKYKIEETLEKAQQVLTDEALRQEVDAFVAEMEEAGVLNEIQVQSYKEQKESLAGTDFTEKPMTLMDRIKAAMTAEEFAFAISMYSKVDTGYILSNIYTDRAAVKKYIKSVLTSDEISKSLAIYNKYSYLLK